MDRPIVHALARVSVASLTLAAILTQLADLAAAGTLNPISYFSYFRSTATWSPPQSC